MRVSILCGIFATVLLAPLSFHAAFAQQPGIIVSGASSTWLENVVQPDIVVAPPTASRIIVSNAQSAAILSVVPPDGFDQKLPPRIKFHRAEKEQRISLPVPSLFPAIPVSIGPPQRVVIFLQGITSYSDCPTGLGLLDRAPVWLEEYLQTDPLIRSKVEVVDYAYFSYSSDYCDNGSGHDKAVPDYQAIDTCSGDISGAYATELRNLIHSVTNRFPGSRVTLVGHSQGGLIASHMIGRLIADDPDFVKQRIASAIVFDSFPKGLPRGPAGIGIAAIQAYFRFNGCGFSPDLSQWVSGQPVTEVAAQAAMPFGDDQYQVAFYTLDAADGPVIAQWTQIRGSRIHELIPNADHREIWDVPTLRKQQLVGCAVIVAYTCDLTDFSGLSHIASRTLPGQTQVVNAVVPSGSLRGIFTVGWSGNKVKLTPITPDGVRLDAGNLPFGSLHRVGADFETYEFIDPPAGEWTLELSGAHLPLGGSPVTVQTDFERPPNVPPFAVAGTYYEADEGDSVVLSAAGSSDPDGQIAQYEWDLDTDGQYEAIGITTTRVVDENGQFLVGLRVTDNDDGIDATTAELVVHNVAPILTVKSNQSVAPGNEVQVDLATFTDPGNLDTHTASIDWGDGTPIEFGNITILSPGTQGDIGGLTGLVTGSHKYNDSGEFSVTVEVCDNDLGCSSGSVEVGVIGTTAAEPSLVSLQNLTDGAVGLKVGVGSFLDPVTGEGVNVVVASSEAQLVYDGACLNILAVRDLDFALNLVSIDNRGGAAKFRGNASGGVAAPTDLGHVLTRLVGSNRIPCQLTMDIARMTDSAGNTLMVTSDLTRDLLRGDGRADGVINIEDALFIAQYLAGSRSACGAAVGTNCLHSVNAASVQQDGSFDQINIGDALVIAQYLTGLRDEFYNPVP